MIMRYFHIIRILAILVIISIPLCAGEKRIYTAAGSSHFPPYEFLDEYGRPSGFNIDILKAIENATGIDINVILLPHNEALDMLSKNRVDFITGFFHIQEENRTHLYSSPFLAVPFYAATTGNTDPESMPLKEGRQLASRPFGLDSIFKTAMPGIIIRPAESDISALRHVKDGSYDCAIISSYSADYLIDRYRMRGMNRMKRPLFTADYSMLFSGETSNLMGRINDGLVIIKRSGEYDRILKKWLSHDKKTAIDKFTKMLLVPIIALAAITSLVIFFYILLRRQVKIRTEALHREINRNYYIADLSRRLLADPSIDGISRVVLEYLCELTGSRHGIAGYISRDSSGVMTIFTYNRNNGGSEFKKIDSELNTENPVLRKLLNEREAFFYNDARSFFNEGDLPAAHICLNKILCSPSLVGERVAGIIIAANSDIDYNDEDLDIVENFSSQFALAVQRMHAQHELIISEKKYRDIFNNVEDLLYFSTLDGNLIEVNNAFEKVFGYTNEELAGRNIIEALSGEENGFYNREEVASFFGRTLIDGSIHGEVKLRTKTGTNKIIEYKNILVLDENGHPAGIQGSARDITERKRFEKILIKAKEKANESDSLKTNFLANMSHEMRTPLNAVIGFTNILIDEVKDPSHENYLRMVQKSGKLLLSIIDEILDLSKIESGSLKIVQAPLNLRSLMKNLYNNTFILTRSGRKNVQIDYEIDPAISELILGDSYRIEQIMNNLLSNAVKFTNAGSIIFSVKLTDSNMLEFTVEDSGIGISPENIPLVFDRFRQIDYGTSRNYGGTGLGLSISKMIVDMMGGEIRVESELNRGSKFTFTMPYHPAAEGEEIRHEAAAARSGGVTVLIAEDNSINRQLVAKVLEKNGYFCLMAVDGVEAVDTYKSGRQIDLILMDIQMPRMDGLEALEIIRQLESDSGTRIPIVAISAHVMKEDVQRFLNAGFDAYIAKPFNKDDLIRTIAELTSRTH